jgi:hypothetical protein
MNATEQTLTGATTNGCVGEGALHSRRSGPNPFVAIGIAFALGVIAAKWIDWRGHAHPR